MRVGELIIEELGYIPAEGEVFPIADAEFTIISGTPRAIDKVQIRHLEQPELGTKPMTSMETAIPDSSS